MTDIALDHAFAVINDRREVINTLELENNSLRFQLEQTRGKLDRLTTNAMQLQSEYHNLRDLYTAKCNRTDEYLTALNHISSDLESVNMFDLCKLEKVKDFNAIRRATTKARQYRLPF